MAVVFAVGTLTFTGQPLNTETVTIGSKTYTFQTTLTNVDGNVLIGGTTAASIANLQAAVNLGAGAGTTYATATTANTQVSCTAITATTAVFSALLGGALGNLIPSTETLTNASFGGTTLASGTGSVYTDLNTLLAAEQLNSSAAQKIIDMVDNTGLR